MQRITDPHLTHCIELPGIVITDSLPAYHFPTSSFRYHANELWAHDAIRLLYWPIQAYDTDMFQYETPMEVIGRFLLYLRQEVLCFTRRLIACLFVCLSSCKNYRPTDVIFVKILREVYI